MDSMRREYDEKTYVFLFIYFNGYYDLIVFII